MVHRRHDRPERCTVTLQLIGDQSQWRLPLPLQELAKEALRCTAVPPRLNEDIDHVSVLIHGTPQILPFAVDRYEDLVQEPCISESTLSSFQRLCIVETEFRAPPADCLVGYDDASFGKQILDISEADTKSIVEPDCMADDFAWISVPVIEGSGAFHVASLAVMGPS